MEKHKLSKERDETMENRMYSIDEEDQITEKKENSLLCLIIMVLNNLT